MMTADHFFTSGSSNEVQPPEKYRLYYLLNLRLIVNAMNSLVLGLVLFWSNVLFAGALLPCRPRTLKVSAAY